MKLLTVIIKSKLFLLLIYILSNISLLQLKYKILIQRKVNNKWASFPFTPLVLFRRPTISKDTGEDDVTWPDLRWRDVTWRYICKVLLMFKHVFVSSKVINSLIVLIDLDIGLIYLNTRLNSSKSELSEVNTPSASSDFPNFG